MKAKKYVLIVKSENHQEVNIVIFAINVSWFILFLFLFKIRFMIIIVNGLIDVLEQITR
jgi:hypothetical protein